MDIQMRLRACAHRWRLEVGDRLDGGFRSDVFACTTSGGGEVVVKLTVTSEEARSEAAALAAWMDTGAAVEILDVDLEYDALLLARIRPGTHLAGGDDPVILDMAADLLSRLQLAAPGPFPFLTLEALYPRLEARAREDINYERRARDEPIRGEAGLTRLDSARAAAMRLCATTPQPVLLHGDFLDKNLLCTGSSYLAVDPIPRIGDPCSDVGMFASDHLPAGTILERAGAIAERMGLDPNRAMRWAAVWTVLLTCSAWRSDQVELDTAVASAEFERLLRP
ncbi:MAG TPA: aminoglycoside phosphotransferase family protein [Mycobacteriales bacterium]|nr:aminoglycoside phosphotransferase family protein [Mycobacteriales bacterium]